MSEDKAKANEFNDEQAIAMKARYLGESEVDISMSPFSDYSKVDWSMYFIERYGGIDGSHHKSWVIDQIARVLKGTNPIIVLARWDRGDNDLIEEYMIRLGEPSQEYLDWVDSIKVWNEKEQAYEYDYDEGIAP